MKHLPEYILMGIGFSLMSVCGILLMMTTDASEGWKYLMGALVGIAIVIGSAELMSE